MHHVGHSSNDDPPDSIKTMHTFCPRATTSVGLQDEKDLTGKARDCECPPTDSPGDSEWEVVDPPCHMDTSGNRLPAHVLSRSVVLANSILTSRVNSCCSWASRAALHQLVSLAGKGSLSLLAWALQPSQADAIRNSIRGRALMLILQWCICSEANRAVVIGLVWLATTAVPANGYPGRS